MAVNKFFQDFLETISLQVTPHKSPFEKGGSSYLAVWARMLSGTIVIKVCRA
jgi:hypothetical protein